MPIYDYKCPSCENIKRDEFVKKFDETIKCEQCRINMIKLVSGGVKARCWPADGVYLEHVSANGKTFKTKKEMIKFANKKNMELGYLL